MNVRQFLASEVLPVNSIRSRGPSSFWSANLMAASRGQEAASSSHLRLLCLGREKQIFNYKQMENVVRTIV